MRRSVAIAVAFQRQTGHEHPNFQAGLGNYSSLLEAMGRTQEPIDELLRPLGVPPRRA